MKLFNRKVKDLEEQIEHLKRERLVLLETNNYWNIAHEKNKSTIEELREENKELKQENVDLLDRLRKILKEVVGQ